MLTPPPAGKAAAMATIMFGIRVVGDPRMQLHPTVRLELHEPPPRFIEYEESDGDWLRYFGYIKPFEFEDTASLLFYEFDAGAAVPLGGVGI
jgi:hypothetical protein